MKTLEERLQAVEDRLEIYNVISAWGPSADGNNLEALERIFAPNGIWDNRDYRYVEGIDDIKQILDSQDHRTLTDSGVAHYGNLPHVELDGDRAIATNYSAVFGRRDGAPMVLRVTVSRYYMSRGPHGWRIDRRVIDPLDGRASARELAGRVFEGPGEDPGGRTDAYSLPAGVVGAWGATLQSTYRAPPQRQD